MADITIDTITDTVGGAVRDGFYIAVGAGVLGFQKLQVQRVELTKSVKAQAEVAKATASASLEGAKDQAGSIGDLVEDRVKLVEERLGALESRLETVLADIERKLPEQAKDLVKQARELVGIAA